MAGVGDDHEEALLGLVKSLSKVQEFMKDPKLRTVVGNIAPHVLNIFPEEPGPAKPLATRTPAVESPTSPALDPATVKPDKSPAVDPATIKPEKAESEIIPEKVHKPAFTPSPPDDKVNSATHRAAHARLARAMQRADPAQFPSMHKLWCGNRKDCYISQKLCVVFKIIT